MNEFIVQCEEDGTVIGPIDRKTAHKDGIRNIVCHQVVIGMVYCTTTKKWCLQKKFSKTIKQEIWDTSVGGHCCYSAGFKLLSPVENMIKEAAEELGLGVVINDKIHEYNLVFVGGELVKPEYSNEFMFFYVLEVADEHIEHPDGEVLEHQWVEEKDMELFFKSHKISHVLELAYSKVKR